MSSDCVISFYDGESYSAEMFCDGGDHGDANPTAYELALEFAKKHKNAPITRQANRMMVEFLLWLGGRSEPNPFYYARLMDKHGHYDDPHYRINTVQETVERTP